MSFPGDGRRGHACMTSSIGILSRPWFQIPTASLAAIKCGGYRHLVYDSRTLVGHLLPHSGSIEKS